MATELQTTVQLEVGQGKKNRGLKIDVISDFVCPWCYIGFLDLSRGIDRAHSARVPVNFSIQYHPFFLNPQLSDNEPVAKTPHLEKKFGKEKWEVMRRMISARAKEEGMHFTFDGVVGNTTRAHRLMLRTYLVHGQTTHLALLRLLFQAFFELARDIGSVDVLAELAVKAILIVQKREERLKKEAEKEGESYDSWQSNASPIPSSEDVQAVSPLTSAPRPFEVSTLSSQLQSEHAIVVEFLQSTTLEAEVRGQSSEAQKKGIAGVPFSVIERKWAVSGCQNPECYFKIFEKLGTMDESALKACMNGHAQSPSAGAS